MKTVSNHQERIYFMNLDIIRFISAYLIVLFHMFYGWQYNWGNPKIISLENGQLSWIGKYVENMIHNFSIGVDVFFLVSGFLITYLLLCEKEKYGKISIGKFYIRRVLRIWPLYFMILALGPILYWWVGEPEPKNYLPHLFFAGNFEVIKNGFSSSAVNHLWSICIEEHFYLICPIIVAFISLKRLPMFFWTIIIVSFCFRGIIVGTDNYWMNMYLNTLSRMDVLAIGCLGAFYYFNKNISFNQSKITLLVLSFFLSVLFINEVYVFWDNFFLATAKKYTFIVVLGVIIGNLMFNEKIQFMPKKKGVFHYLGKVSYGIYMFNPIVVALFIKHFYKFNFIEGFIYFFGVQILLLVIVIFSFELIEKQFLKLKDKFSVVQTRKY